MEEKELKEECGCVDMDVEIEETSNDYFEGLDGDMQVELSDGLGDDEDE